jgi:hypothetical protein
MVDLLIAVILSGFAITFAIELLALLLVWFFNKETLYTWLSLPLAFIGMFVLYNIDKTFFISVPATAFIALVLRKYLNAPVVTSTRLKRL